MIYWLAAITAFSSFVNEINLSQALSGALGGTILRYHTGFALFTCFLGLGAWAFDRLNTRFVARRILIAAQFFMLAGGVLGPLWIQHFNPLNFAASLSPVLTVLCYLPILVIAFISGVELPALMAIGRERGRPFEILGFDYVGMFAASVVYPLALLYAFGVWGAATFAAGLNLFVLVALWRRSHEAPARPPEASGPAGTVTERNLPPALVVSLIFLFSFCSMAYELLLAKAVADFIGDEVLAHSVTIGVYLLGLGLGTFAANRVVKTQLRLVQVEIGLTAVALFALPFFTVAATWWNVTQLLSEELRAAPWLLVLLAPLAIIIGFLSGFELPLLLRSWRQPTRLGAPLCVNYFGALIAGFSVPLLLLPGYGVGASITLVAILNLLGAALLLVRAPAALRVQGFTGVIILGLLLPRFVGWNASLEQIFLKAHYFELRVDRWTPATLQNFLSTTAAIGKIQRQTSPYQFIDVINKDAGKNLGPLSVFSLYLNRQPQFTSDTWTTYHESMILGALNLTQSRPKDILLLGGGDGLLAQRLFQLLDAEKITVIELDPQMIDLARNHPDLRRMNENVFDHPRLQLVVDDAFHFIHRTSRRYDAVFIDFPYPHSFELSRLFSVEFYRQLKRVMKPEAFMVMDAPLWYDLEAFKKDSTPHEVLFNTLEAAGFPAMRAFGPIEPFLVATPARRTLAFAYDKLPAGISNRTFVNLTDLDFLVLPFAPVVPAGEFGLPSAEVYPVMNRRELLLLLVLAGGTGPAGAFHIERILGPVKVAYLREYFARMWRWYGKEFADLDRHLTTAERALVKAWATELVTWGVSLPPNQTFDHFLFSHRVEKDQVDHARFAMGQLRWSPGCRLLLKQVLRERGLPLSENIYGVGWNFARDEFKIYNYYPQAGAVSEADVRPWSLSHEGPLWSGPRISCHTYRGGKAVKKKLIVPLRRLDWSVVGMPAPVDAVSAMKIIETGDRLRWHFRLKSFFFPSVHLAGWPALSKHAKEFHQLANSIIFENRDRYTVYYP